MNPLPPHQKLEMMQNLRLKVHHIIVMAQTEGAYLLAGLEELREENENHFLLYFLQSKGGTVAVLVGFCFILFFSYNVSLVLFKFRKTVKCADLINSDPPD